MRPTTLDQFIGQSHLVGEGGLVNKMIESGSIPSMIFWGPPAVGKTTLAQIIGARLTVNFEQISAVMDGKEALRQVLDRAEDNRNNGQSTILFIDEIHRWNKAQQDALLPHLENGDLTLIGATTENPSFQIIPALLSRTQVLVFEPLSSTEIVIGLQRGLVYLENQSDGWEKGIVAETLTEIKNKSLEILAGLANGDIRFALNTLAIAYAIDPSLESASLTQAAQRSLRYDRSGEEHYNLISAVHKSLRSSNSTAAVYWIVRMLEGGEDPLYIARRLLRFASEDIGNSNPNALLLANQVFEACHKLGMPECGVHLVQLAEYLSKSAKSNSAYTAYNMARADAKRYGNLSVPLHLRNAPTKLMKQLDYGKNYEYDHDLESGKSDQQCLPDVLIKRDYFNKEK